MRLTDDGCTLICNLCGYGSRVNKDFDIITDNEGKILDAKQKP